MGGGNLQIIRNFTIVAPIQSYFEVFYSLLVGEIFRTLKIHQFVILGYQLLPLATSKLMDDNEEFNDSVIF